MNPTDPRRPSRRDLLAILIVAAGTTLVLSLALQARNTAYGQVKPPPTAADDPFRCRPNSSAWT